MAKLSPPPPALVVRSSSQIRTRHCLSLQCGPLFTPISTSSSSLLLYHVPVIRLPVERLWLDGCWLLSVAPQCHCSIDPLPISLALDFSLGGLYKPQPLLPNDCLCLVHSLCNQNLEGLHPLSLPRAMINVSSHRLPNAENLIFSLKQLPWLLPPSLLRSLSKISDPS